MLPIIIKSLSTNRRQFQLTLNKFLWTLFADDTSIIFTNSNFEDCKNYIKIEFEFLSKWFKANRLSLNFDKIHFIQFTTKNSPQIDLDISCANKLISKAYDTKFLGIYVDSTLSLKLRIENITHKLSAVWCAVRSVKPFLSQETLKMVYHAYFYSIMNCGLIFWGNCYNSAKKI
jgi:hypothetical protein